MDRECGGERNERGGERNRGGGSDRDGLDLEALEDQVFLRGIASAVSQRCGVTCNSRQLACWILETLI